MARMFGRFGDEIAWRRSKGQVDDRLLGSWVPQVGEADGEDAPSWVFEEAYAWRRTRQLDGPRMDPMAYRVVGAGRLLMRSRDQLTGRFAGALTPWTYRFDSESLVLGNRRYTRADDADDRPWPPELGLSVSRP